MAVRRTRECIEWRKYIVQTYRTDEQIESLLFPALGLVSTLNELALAGSAKARKSLFGLVSIGNQLVKGLKVVRSK
jgi:hypothetical protein